MKQNLLKKALVFLAAIVIFASCDSTVQYDVLVENQTDNPLRIEYKSVHDTRGEIAEAITIPSGAQERIISTKSIKAEDGQTNTNAGHCNLAAEYIRAFSGDNPSKIAWCSDKVKFQKVDIGQAEFIITFTENDF